jgi:hypothetical protein
MSSALLNGRGGSGDAGAMLDEAVDGLDEEEVEVEVEDEEEDVVESEDLVGV